jgi:nucleoside-diphosphate-sugar epimerase
MKIAVTGATGFLGRYIVSQLAGAGHTLRCWYRPGSDRNGFEDFDGRMTWVPGQLGDQEAAETLVGGLDAVVHAALARPDGAGFRASAQTELLSFLEANLFGSLRLMHAARAAGVGRFVLVSTCAVYEVICEDRRLDEAHPMWPGSHYGAHKAALEEFVHSYGIGEGWPICALRPTGIYGVARPVEHSKWFDLVGGVTRGEPVRSAAGGKEVHAADVARAVDVLLHADVSAVAGQSFNCYDRYVAEQDVARIAKELSGSRSAIELLNRGPKHQIETTKLRALGMTFGGDELLRDTVATMIEAHRCRRA